MHGEKITVGPPFYNRVAVPIGLFLLLLTGTGPLLAGQSASLRSIRKKLVAPAIAGGVTAVVLVLFGIHPWADQGALYSLVCFLSAAFVLTAIVTEFLRAAAILQHQTGASLLISMVRLTLGNTRRYGAFIVHFGIALMFVGFAGSAFNRTVEAELESGQTMDIGPYQLVSRGFAHISNDNYIAEQSRIDVYRRGKHQFQLAPELRLYQASQTTQTMVANHSTPLWDLYVVYGGQNQDSGLPVIKAILNPLVLWIWIGACIVLFGTLVAITPDQRTKLFAGSKSTSAPLDRVLTNTSAR
jgi:cytochrome c-type biogenesis protein CcmF